MALALASLAALGVALAVGFTVAAAVLAWQVDQPPRTMPATEGPARRGWHLPAVTTPAPSAAWIEALRFEPDDTVTWSAVEPPPVVHPRSLFGRGDVLDRLLMPACWDDPSPVTHEMEAIG